MKSSTDSGMPAGREQKDRPAIQERQSDEELIAAFQAGDTVAFNLLVGRYKDPLMNFVYRYVGDYDEADDIVQETFVRVFRKKHTYRPIAKFSTWVYTIATNLAKSQLRRRKRHALFSLTRRKEDDQESSLGDYQIADERYTADSLVESMLKQEIIQNALNSIPEKYREAVVLFDIQEFSYEEICSITGLNMGTLKSRLNRGRTQLQKLLKDLKEE